MGVKIQNLLDKSDNQHFRVLQLPNEDIHGMEGTSDRHLMPLPVKPIEVYHHENNSWVLRNGRIHYPPTSLAHLRSHEDSPKPTYLENPENEERPKSVC